MISPLRAGTGQSLSGLIHEHIRHVAETLLSTMVYSDETGSGWEWTVMPLTTLFPYSYNPITDVKPLIYEAEKVEHL
jgi:hypothetical protein